MIKKLISDFEFSALSLPSILTIFHVIAQELHN